MNGEILRFPDDFLWGAVAASPPSENEVELLRSLGIKACRLSLDWSLLEPDEGAWAEEVAEDYLRVLASLQEARIVTFVTLQHRIPPWLASYGGWESEKITEAFEGYARGAMRSFGAHVAYWVTLDAPSQQMYRGYIAGSAPPGVRSLRRAMRARKSMIVAHAGAYHVIRDETEKLGLTAQVGLAEGFTVFDPSRNAHFWDVAAVRNSHNFFNRFILESLRTGLMVSPFGFVKHLPEMENCFDFVDASYRGRELVRFRPWRPADIFGQSVADDGDRQACTRGLYRVLENVATFGKPVFVTESAVAADDEQRSSLMVSHLMQVHDAIQSGGDVRGYFHRVPSDHLYARICAENGIPAEIVRRHYPKANASQP